jgi:hypothetical protein
MPKRNRAPTKARPWQPMAPASPLNPEVFAANEGPHATIWKNDRYTVIATPEQGDWDGPVWLSIRRNDRKALRDWRHFQNIKNDIVGEEREGMEIFPAESRLVDTANQYHIWCTSAGVPIPVGFTKRMVTDEDGNTFVDGKKFTPEELAEKMREMGVSEEMNKAKQRARYDA